jgi:hypothetical protein
MVTHMEGQPERLHIIHSRVFTTPSANIVQKTNPLPNQQGSPEYGSFEPYVDEEVVACFLTLTPRRVLELAREGLITSHPIGRTRKTWRFRISEVAADMETSKKPPRAKIPQAVPGTKERNRLG